MIGPMRASGIGIGIGIAFLACGGNSGPVHVELSGKTPAEAAALAARAVCLREARCGQPSIACMGGGAAGGSGSDASAPTMSCVATIRPVAYDDCYADASTDIAELLTCAAPTAEQIDVLEICFDMLAARRCITQAEADALARASETGTSPPADELPAACALLMNPPASC
jgi:hypothetical protein